MSVIGALQVEIDVEGHKYLFAVLQHFLILCCSQRVFKTPRPV